MMKREALIRELRAAARKNDVFFKVCKDEGNGSHYAVYYGDHKTIIQSGEIMPLHVKNIKKQLGIK